MIAESLLSAPQNVFACRASEISNSGSVHAPSGAIFNRRQAIAVGSMCHNETTTVSVSSRAGVDGAPGHAITLCNERTSVSADRSLGQAWAGSSCGGNHPSRPALPARCEVAVHPACRGDIPGPVLDGHALVDKRTDRTRAPRSSLTSIGSGLGHSQTSAVSRTHEVPIWLLRGLPAVTRLREQANTRQCCTPRGPGSQSPPCAPLPLQVPPSPRCLRSSLAPDLTASCHLSSWRPASW